MIAQAPPKPIRSSLIGYSLLPETVWIALLGFADLLSTVYWLERGATETNPILAYCLSFGLAAFCWAKLLALFAPLAFLEWCWWHYNGAFIQRLLRYLLFLYLFGYIGLFWLVNH